MPGSTAARRTSRHRPSQLCVCLAKLTAVPARPRWPGLSLARQWPRRQRHRLGIHSAIQGGGTSGGGCFHDDQVFHDAQVACANGAGRIGRDIVGGNGGSAAR